MPKTVLCVNFKNSMKAAKIILEGVVQGIGFRPFIHRLAASLGLLGRVYNTGGGVEILVEGRLVSLKKFYLELSQKAPPLTRIKKISFAFVPAPGLKEFRIEISQKRRRPSEHLLISPDTSFCNFCLEELKNTADRRNHYPFINCTNCGPRFSIIYDLPYDRAKTTMKKFKMCPECLAEYQNILSRRYHAEPNACPKCGPKVWLENSRGAIIETKDIFEKARKFIKQGKILAVKGVGGFHLILNAADPAAVRLLRARKNRPFKPLALMVRDLAAARRIVKISQEEAKFLEDLSRPIVLAEKTGRSLVSKEIAPHLNRLGVMLPPSPLHYLLFETGEEILVATSGNFSDEPILSDNAEAQKKLAGIADYFLMHNRDIFQKADDSIVFFLGPKPVFIRAGRGLVPEEIEVNLPGQPVLALGPELKSTFCFLLKNQAVLSQHLGDLQNLASFQNYQRTLKIFQKFLAVRPKIIAIDLNRDYFSSVLGENLKKKDKGLKLVAVKHHHAHIASVMAEQGLKGPVVGIAFDGAGLGSDGAIWGGEFLKTTLAGFERLAHLKYASQPGGDIAAQEPWRMALSYLYEIFGPEFLNFDLDFIKKISRQKIQAVVAMIKSGFNCPPTSSVGRLFDGVAALLGVCFENTYESQAAAELEAVGQKGAGRYQFKILEEGIEEGDEGSLILDFKPVILGVLEDLKNQKPVSLISYKFHQALAWLVKEVSDKINKKEKLTQLVLAGGVWQNQTLLTMTQKIMNESRYQLFLPKRLPPNDAGVSLGQAVVARFRKG